MERDSPCLARQGLSLCKKRAANQDENKNGYDEKQVVDLLKDCCNYAIRYFNSTTRAVGRIILRKWHNQEHREDNSLPNLQLVARPQWIF